MNLKQKTVEEYLCFDRNDIFSGEQLIELYSQYIGFSRYEKLRPDIIHFKAEALRFSLLLHNEEDLIGLSKICYFLYYIEIIKGNFSIEHIDLYCDKTYMQNEYNNLLNDKKTVQFILNPNIKLGKDDLMYFNKSSSSITLPFCLLSEENEFMLYFKAGKILFSITYYEGELKYFFNDYKDYYYLTEEDTAVHKSIGEYVDKAYRQKAKKTNCYQRKYGIFLPQPIPIFSPVFKNSYKDKYTYFEIIDNVFADLNLTKDYLISILNFNL